MSDKEIIIAVGIHFVIPLIGLLYYFWMVHQTRKEKIPNAPIIELFVIFSTYGGLLLAVLTTLFWKWSLMASIGSLYLILGAPILMGLIGYRRHRTRDFSKYHSGVYVSSMAYFIVTPVVFLLLHLIK